MVFVKRVIERRKVILRWNGKVTTIESFAKIAFVATDGLVDSDQVRARCESSFDLQLLERGENAGVNMSAAEDLLAEVKLHHYVLRHH